MEGGEEGRDVVGREVMNKLRGDGVGNLIGVRYIMKTGGGRERGKRRGKKGRERRREAAKKAKRRTFFRARTARERGSDLR